MNYKAYAYRYPHDGQRIADRCINVHEQPVYDETGSPDD
jgi:hypothetical protein